ncbi:hypothetical protein HK407_04g07990 [Ordospora pajunii]|jgi:hypothetical protein|uniref:uncharacterized protein n=1 Tax=Ordospora pajunii TaxID=3039483 RepID=UPI002952916D|nr:uncharacterized protein HK407_04g07990 [Ordospora pajunii]KAH9411689.1 hypothetical protein HK407_04g07990 [Ordospora pajunii]
MIRCTYTSQKQKKQKLWLDGFVSLKGKKVSLYDSEKKMIESSFLPAVENDMEMQKYLVYVDSFEDLESECAELDEEERKPGNRIDKCNNARNIKDASNSVNVSEYKHSANTNMHSRLGRVPSGIEAEEPMELSEDKEHGCVSKGRSSSEIIDLFRRL